MSSKEKLFIVVPCLMLLRVFVVYLNVVARRIYNKPTCFRAVRLWL